MLEGLGHGRQNPHNAGGKAINYQYHIELRLSEVPSTGPKP